MDPDRKSENQSSSIACAPLTMFITDLSSLERFSNSAADITSTT